MAKVYRLISGKISRSNAEGVNETHKAPYDFVPTKGEYEANKFRLRLVGEDTTDTVKVVEPLLESTERDIRKMDVRAALAYIQTVVSTAQLDSVLLEESTNKPKVRRMVIEAIETRRAELAPDTKSTEE